MLLKAPGCYGLLMLSVLGCHSLFGGWVREEVFPYHYEMVFYPDETTQFYYSKITTTPEERLDQARQVYNSGGNVGSTDEQLFKREEEEERNRRNPPVEPTPERAPVPKKEPARKVAAKSAPTGCAGFLLDVKDYTSALLVGRTATVTLTNRPGAFVTKILEVPPEKDDYFKLEKPGGYLLIPTKDILRIEIHPISGR